MCLAEQTRIAFLAKMREECITQAELARRVGADRQYIWGVLHGVRTVSMDKADELAAAIGCRIQVELVPRSRK